MRQAWLAAVLLAIGAGLAAQEFHPPPVRPAGGHGTRIGLFGFGTRGGIDLTGRGQLVLGATLDAGDLFTNRLRIRPSGEVGVLNGPNSYLGSFELLLRLVGDQETVAPYLGGGLSLAGHTGCGVDPGCPGLWLSVAVGVELRYRSTFNWLLEYRALDGFARNRLYLGLTTRRGN